MNVTRFFSLWAVVFALQAQSVFAQAVAVGDRVVISATTKVMAGAESRGNVGAGTEFAVEQINEGGWLRGTFTIGGQRVSGWVKTSDIRPAKARPAAAAADAPPWKDDAANYRTAQETFQRMISRYDRKYEFPATMYGFLPIRQGLPESVPANANMNSLEVLMSDVRWAREPFDPITAREAETGRLLQSLPASGDVEDVLEKVRQAFPARDDAEPSSEPVKLLDLSTAAELPLFLEKLAKNLPTDAYAIAQRRYQQLSGQLGADDPQTIASLAWVFYMRRLHNGVEVENTHHRLLDWARKKHGEGHPLTSRAWNNLALVRHDRGDFEAARKILLHALAARTADKMLAADLPLLLINLARVLETEGRTAESQRCGELSRTITRLLPQQLRELVAASYLREFADPRIPETGAGPFYMRSGIVYRPSITNYAGFGGARGRRDGNETERSNYDALNMTQIFGGANGGYVYTPFMLASAHFSRQGDFGAAERFSRKAIELARQQFANQPQMHWHITMNHQSLAMTLSTIGNHEAALEVLKEGIKLQRPLWDKEWKDAQAAFAGGQAQFFAFSQYGIYAQLLVLEAKTLADMGRLEEAERAYRDALVVAKMPTSIDNRAMTAMTSHAPQCEAELAGVLLRLGKHQEAEKILRSILAADYLRWCFAMWKETRTIGALSALASIIARNGTPDNLTTAARMYHDAYLHATVSGYEGTQRQLVDYSRTLQRSGRQAEAIQVLERSIAYIDSARRGVGGDEINRARYFSEMTRLDPYSELAQLLVEVGPGFRDHFGVGEFGATAAFDALEKGRGRSLLDLMSRGGEDVATAAMTHARNINDQALIQRVEQIRAQELDARRQVAAILDRGAATNQNALAPLQAELDVARKAEIQAKRDLFDIAKETLEKNTLQPLTAQQAAKLLQPNEALLVYDVSEGRSLRLLLWPDGRMEGEFLQDDKGQPVGEQRLAGSIADFFQEISREEAGDAPSTESTNFQPVDLRKALLPDPVLEKLKGCARLFVVGDGPLHRLSFESLFLDESGEKVLLDEIPAIAYGPSATILLHSRIQQKQPSAKERLALVALGDPQFSKAGGEKASTAGDGVAAVARTRSLNRFGTLSPLPGTRAEIDLIRQILITADKANADRVQILSGADATVTNLFRGVNQPRFLHLATHGLAEGGRRAYDSALALAAPEKVTPDDTGFLRLSDLLAQWGGKLNGTELVVLSACRTARGEMESGDGFVALTWGFLFAGTKAVVASLWEVDDTATALLMARLYENLLGTFDQPRKIGDQTFEPGRPVPQCLALREAKLWLRQLDHDGAAARVKELLGEKGRVPSGDRPFADPFYWGAFVLIGNAE